MCGIHALAPGAVPLKNGEALMAGGARHMTGNAYSIALAEFLASALIISVMAAGVLGPLLF